LPRIARARNVTVDRIARILDAHAEGRALGVIGEPHVNVLELNRQLDMMSATAAK